MRSLVLDRALEYLRFSVHDPHAEVNSAGALSAEDDRQCKVLSEHSLSPVERLAVRGTRPDPFRRIGIVCELYMFLDRLRRRSFYRPARRPSIPSCPPQQRSMRLETQAARLASRDLALRRVFRRRTRSDAG